MRTTITAAAIFITLVAHEYFLADHSNRRRD
jgi:hypothetical protein